MQKYSSLLILIPLIFSCTANFKVDELCSARSIIDGAYGTRNESLPLIEDNNIPYETLDTMYFKVEKTTGYKFKLENKMEYEALKTNADFEVESYIYLKRYPHPEKGARTTFLQHKIPKYTDKRIKTVCPKDLTIGLLEMIKKRLIQEGYPLNRSDKYSKFEGALKDELINFQKTNHLPYGKIDIATLKKLGISVKEK